MSKKPYIVDGTFSAVVGSEWVDIQVTAWRPLPEAFEVEEKQ